jgi:hypothetical protein
MQVVWISGVGSLAWKLRVAQCEATHVSAKTACDRTGSGDIPTTSWRLSMLAAYIASSCNHRTHQAKAMAGTKGT